MLPQVDTLVNTLQQKFFRAEKPHCNATFRAFERRRNKILFSQAGKFFSSQQKFFMRCIPQNAIILLKGVFVMASNREYKAANFDKVQFWARKGKNSECTALAAALGLGRMEMLRLAVDEFIERHGGADETQAESAETTQNAQVNGEVPIIYSERNQTAQNQPVSTNVQTIQPATENVPQRITGNEKRLIEAVKTLTPESQKALLKFLQTLQG